MILIDLFRSTALFEGRFFEGGISMLKQQKAKIIEEMEESLSSAHLILLTDYKGMSVESITKLRDELRKVNGEYRVIKNTLLRISLKNAGINTDDRGSFDGTTAILFTSGDPILALKAFYNFSNDNANIPVVKWGFMERQFITADQAKELSTLPPRDVLLAQLIGQMQAPIYSLHAVLSSLLRNFLHVLDGIKDKKSN